MDVRDGPLGTNEEILLIGIRELKEDAYGLQLHMWLEKVTGRKYSVGTIYTTTSRLQAKGLIGSQERIVEKRPRRYFWLEATGHNALSEQEAMRKRMESPRILLSRPDLGGAM